MSTWIKLYRKNYKFRGWVADPANYHGLATEVSQRQKQTLSIQLMIHLHLCIIDAKKLSLYLCLNASIYGFLQMHGYLDEWGFKKYLLGGSKYLHIYFLKIKKCKKPDHIVKSQRSLDDANKERRGKTSTFDV